MKAVFGTARAMLWAGCKGDDPSLTLIKAGDLVGSYVRAGGTVDTVLGKCFEAASAQGAIGSPAPEEGDGEDDESGNVSPPTPTASAEASKRGASGSKKPNP